MTLRRNRLWTGVWASFVVVLLLSGATSFAWGQVTDFKLNENSLKSAPQEIITRKGNLDIAPVRLDGRTVLNVSERTPESSDTGTAPIQLRVQRIEFRLQDLLQILNTIVQKDPKGFDPDQLLITVSTLNRQTVILAAYSDLLRPREITTITELDVEADWQYSTVSELAEAESKNIRQALLKSLSERQPLARQQQLQTAILTLMVLIVTTVCLHMIQKWLNNWQQRQLLPSRGASIGETLVRDIDQPSPISVPSKPKGLRLLLPLIRPMISKLDRSWELIQSIRWQLLNLLILTWLLGLINVCLQVPELRDTGQWLLKLPLSLLLTCVGALLLKQICQISMMIGLRQWARKLARNPLQSARVDVRVPTIVSAMQEMINLLILLGSILFFLAIIQVPTVIIVAIIGFLAFLAQDLVKNWISGSQILLEDQFALGDLIRIGNVTGVVEYFSLRITRVRTLVVCQRKSA